MGGLKVQSIHQRDRILSVAIALPEMGGLKVACSFCLPSSVFSCDRPPRDGWVERRSFCDEPFVSGGVAIALPEMGGLKASSVRHQGNQ